MFLFDFLNARQKFRMCTHQPYYQIIMPSKEGKRKFKKKKKKKQSVRLISLPNHELIGFNERKVYIITFFSIIGAINNTK